MNAWMQYATDLGIGAAAGSGLAILFFAGLWATLKRLPQVRRRAPLLIIGLALRFTLVLTGFFLLLRDGHWARGLAALLGFLLVRAILLHRLRQPSIAAEGTQGSPKS